MRGWGSAWSNKALLANQPQKVIFADPALLTPPPADANILINLCRLNAQRYYFAYQEPMPVEQLVRALCDTKQVRTCVIGGVCACVVLGGVCTEAALLWCSSCVRCATQSRRGVKWNVYKHGLV